MALKRFKAVDKKILNNRLVLLRHKLRKSLNISEEFGQKVKKINVLCRLVTK